MNLEIGRQYPVGQYMTFRLRQRCEASQHKRPNIQIIMPCDAASGCALLHSAALLLAELFSSDFLISNLPPTRFCSCCSKKPKQTIERSAGRFCLYVTCQNKVEKFEMSICDLGLGKSQLVSYCPVLSLTELEQRMFALVFVGA